MVSLFLLSSSQIPLPKGLKGARASVAAVLLCRGVDPSPAEAVLGRFNTDPELPGYLLPGITPRSLEINIPEQRG